jgi:hypothetical protein
MDSGHSSSRDRSNSDSNRDNYTYNGNVLDNEHNNPVFKNPRYPDIMNVASGANRFQTESKSNFCVHKVLPSGKKF